MHCLRHHKRKMCLHFLDCYSYLHPLIKPQLKQMHPSLANIRRCTVFSHCHQILPRHRRVSLDYPGADTRSIAGRHWFEPRVPEQAWWCINARNNVPVLLVKRKRVGGWICCYSIVEGLFLSHVATNKSIELSATSRDRCCRRNNTCAANSRLADWEFRDSENSWMKNRAGFFQGTLRC